MQEQISGYLIVTPVRVKKEKIKPEIMPDFRIMLSMLEEHACYVDEDPLGFLITYPGGTTKHELYPRGEEARFKVLLPDGFEVREIENRNGEISVSIVIK